SPPPERSQREPGPHHRSSAADRLRGEPGQRPAQRRAPRAGAHHSHRAGRTLSTRARGAPAGRPGPRPRVGGQGEFAARLVALVLASGHERERRIPRTRAKDTHERERRMPMSASPRRFTLSAFCFTCLALSYMDRWNLSIAAPLLMKEFGWNETTMGLLQSVFFYGFTLTHLPGGWLADRFGGRRVLGAGTLGWTLATGETPLTGAEPARVARVPWGLLLRRRAVWALLVTTFITNWTAWFTYSWVPTYFIQAHGFSLKGSGVVSAVPNLVMIAAGLVAGWV